ncbi:hypothetical protein R3F64_01485 [Halomonas sp. 5021]|uniref:hypothetical protein n=1 Tax=Halomonas sp. 5021 TaxID=3082156 RepID=UPI002FCA5B2B
MTAQRSTDTGQASTLKDLFMEYEDGELVDLTHAINNGDYHRALEVAKQISVLINRISSGQVKAPGK